MSVFVFKFTSSTSSPLKSTNSDASDVASLTPLHQHANSDASDTFDSTIFPEQAISGADNSSTLMMGNGGTIASSTWNWIRLRNFTIRRLQEQMKPSSSVFVLWLCPLLLLLSPFLLLLLLLPPYSSFFSSIPGFSFHPCSPSAHSKLLTLSLLSCTYLSVHSVLVEYIEFLAPAYDGISQLINTT